MYLDLSLNESLLSTSEKENSGNNLKLLGIQKIDSTNSIRSNPEAEHNYEYVLQKYFTEDERL